MKLILQTNIDVGTDEVQATNEYLQNGGIQSRVNEDGDIEAIVTFNDVSLIEAALDEFTD